MSVFQGYTVNDGHYYKVLSNGSAPPNLGVGDLVVTGGGTYLITSVKVTSSEGVSSLIATSSYTSILYDKNLTTRNFIGTYLEPPKSTQALIDYATTAQTAVGGSITSGSQNNDLYEFEIPDNYIYFYHLDQFIFLPLHADSVQDQISVNFERSTPLSRSAPIYSYKNSGPRVVQVGFDLHRDLMTDLNYQKSNVPIGPELSIDYVDVLINYLQAAALPVYNMASKMVNPPIVAMRMGRDIFIKGVIGGSVGLTYKFPVLENGKYALVGINFSIEEIDPYDAWDAVKYGSYRGLDTTLESRLNPTTLTPVIVSSDVASGGIATATRIRQNNTRDRRLEDI